MNVLPALEVAAVALGMLWAGQSIVLKLVGEPLAWPLRFTTRKPVVRFTSRVMIHVSWLVILVGTPLALGFLLSMRCVKPFHCRFPGATSQWHSRSCFSRPRSYTRCTSKRDGRVSSRSTIEQSVMPSSCDVFSDRCRWQRWRRVFFEEFCLSSFFGHFRAHTLTRCWRSA